MRWTAAWLLVLAGLPRVEDPWPDVIGIDFPFTIAGGFGFLASVLYGKGSDAERDEAIRSGGLLGFWLGAIFYFLSLLSQVISAP